MSPFAGSGGGAQARGGGINAQYAQPYANLPPCKPAVPGAPAPTGNCSWFDPRNVDPSHLQNVTYDKANETLAELIEYTNNKVDNLKGLLANHDANSDQQVKDTLRDFCVGTDDAQGCFNRYERYTELNIERMRVAIMKNDTANANLLSRQKDKNTGALVKNNDTAAVELLPPSDGRTAQPPNKPIAGYIPTYNDVKAMYDSQHANAQANMQASISVEFAQWLTDTQSDNRYAAPPKPEDFPKFKKILRDPDNPSAGFFTVIDTDPRTGKPNYDKKAYRAAMAAYNGGTSLSVDADALKAAHGLLRPPGSPGGGPMSPVHASSTVDDPTRPGVTVMNANSVDSSAFNRAEYQLVNKLNQSMGSPTASPSGIPSGSRTPSGSKAVKVDNTVVPDNNGNLAIVPPRFSAPGAPSSYTIRMPLHDVEKGAINTMQTDPAFSNPGQADDSVIELPPGSGDPND